MVPRRGESDGGRSGTASTVDAGRLVLRVRAPRVHQPRSVQLVDTAGPSLLGQREGLRRQLSPRTAGDRQGLVDVSVVDN